MSCTATCACNEKMINTKTGCVTSRAVEKQPWIVNRTKADGTRNYIDLTTTLNDAYFSGLMNKVDPLERVFALPEIKNITDAREKSVMEAAKDGTMYKVRDGVRKFDGAFFPPFASPQLVSILQSQQCASPCKYSVDANGTIWGVISADGTKLYPMRMDAGSIDAVYVNPTDGEVEKVNYSFNLHPSEKDAQVRGLKCSDLIGDINPLDYTGLMDVTMTVVSISTLQLVVKLKDSFGSALTPEVVKGFLVTDFTMTESASPYSVWTAFAITGAGSSFAESPDGTYTFIFPTGTPATTTHHMKLIPVKTGFDCSTV